MEKFTLKAAKRTVTGHKVKTLRKKGIVPANIYGKKITSQAIEVNEKEFAAVFAKAGETGLVSLLIDGKEHPVLIHNLQVEAVSREPLHIDFFQVDIKEKVSTKVPLVIVGESSAVKDKIGVLLNLLTEVEIEALPADLPEKIEVDVSGLSALDQAVKIEEIKIPDKVKVLTDTNLDVVKVAPLVSKEAEAMVKEEAEKAATAAAAETATEEAPATETPAPTTEKTAESSPQPAK